uniref:Uncharacterized protein n=1 Tax=Hyaloperonospora arabidopsidis (strain Emoy2) TaxID=559515 RepID=M4BW60_HYAAE
MDWDADALVIGNVHILFAVAMQHLSDLMSNPSMWVFLFACNASTHMGIACMGDQRLRLAPENLLFNIYLLAIPMYDHNTAVNQVNLIPKVMDVMNPGWCDKLIGLPSDCESTMTAVAVE